MGLAFRQLTVRKRIPRMLQILLLDDSSLHSQHLGSPCNGSLHDKHPPPPYRLPSLSASCIPTPATLEPSRCTAVGASLREKLRLKLCSIGPPSAPCPSISRCPSPLLSPGPSTIWAHDPHVSSTSPSR